MFSSLDIKIVLHGRCVKLERRDNDGRESMRIMLRFPGYGRSSSERWAQRAYSEAPETGNVFSLMPVTALRAVKVLALRRCGGNLTLVIHSVFKEKKHWKYIFIGRLNFNFFLALF